MMRDAPHGCPCPGVAVDDESATGAEMSAAYKSEPFNSRMRRPEAGPAAMAAELSTVVVQATVLPTCAADIGAEMPAALL